MDTDVVKIDKFDKLVIKVNAIDSKKPGTSGLVTNTQNDLGKEAREKNWGSWQKAGFEIQCESASPTHSRTRQNHFTRVFRFASKFCKALVIKW